MGSSSNYQLLTTMDHGRLYIGYYNENDSNAMPCTLGEGVSCYNNFLTKWWARFWEKSIILEVGGEAKDVNKKEFEAHLRSILPSSEESNDVDTRISSIMNTLKTAYNYQETIFTSKFSPPQNTEPFTSHVPLKKRKEFTRYLVHELNKNFFNPLTVKILIRQGADLNRASISNNQYKHYNEVVRDFAQPKPSFPLNPGESISYDFYTPLSRVVDRNETDLAAFIFHAKNEDMSKDEKVTVHIKKDGSKLELTITTWKVQQSNDSFSLVESGKSHATKEQMDKGWNWAG